MRLKAEADKLGAAAHTHPSDMFPPVTHPHLLASHQVPCWLSSFLLQILKYDRVLALEMRLKSEADKLGAAAHSHPSDIPHPVAHPRLLPLTECLAGLLAPADPEV
jgi:hypothetical protein